jgi:hypothetical protein
MKSITDEYVRQWVTTIYKEIKDYDHFKQAISELLWGPQVQSQVRCSIYQDKFDRTGDDSLSAHFVNVRVRSYRCCWWSLPELYTACAFISKC